MIIGTDGFQEFKQVWSHEHPVKKGSIIQFLPVAVDRIHVDVVMITEDMGHGIKDVVGMDIASLLLIHGGAVKTG